VRTLSKDKSTDSYTTLSLLNSWCLISWINIRPCAMVMNGGVESMIQHLLPFQWCVEVGGKMIWRREELNEFNIVEACNRGTRGAFWFMKTGACATRADRGKWACRRMREKMLCEKVGDTWLILIGCLYFFHLNNLNSIISLQINFYFLTKFMIFFLSINRDLVHLIWTQKKKSFSLS